MRLAYFSPLPPLRSGIADYSQELLPHLSQHAEIELVVDAGDKPGGSLSDQYAIRSYREFRSLASSQRYDAVLYHIGNDAQFHEHIYRMLLEYPGIVVLHEFVLQHLIQGMTLGRGKRQAYVREMRYCYGRKGVRLARAMLETGWPVDAWAYPLFERVVDACLGVIVHNDYTRQRILASRPLARVARVNSPYCPDSVPDGDVRVKLGLPRDAFVVGSFGFITPQKRLEASVRAFASLRKTRPNAIYVMVGEVSPHYDIKSLLQDGLDEGVLLTGRVGKDTFLRYMASVDLAVNLRYPTAGETSATLIRLMGLGKPTIVSNVGAFSEYPDDCCIKVDIDNLEEEMLSAMMCAVVDDENLRRQIGVNAQRYIKTQHTLEAAAQRYLDFVRRIIASPSTAVDTGALLDWPDEDDALVGLIAEIAAEVADLGLHEGDESVLREMAKAVLELGVSPASLPRRTGGRYA